MIDLGKIEGRVLEANDLGSIEGLRIIERKDQRHSHFIVYVLIAQ